MGTPSDRRTAWLVFALVGAGFTTLYLPQPVLPQLRAEFGVDEARASLTVSAVILGMALSNLPFGALADRHPVRPIVLAGGGLVALSSLLAALSGSLGSLVTLRFLQGLSLPALTTCLAAHLARTVAPGQLHAAMGSYVSATVVGGLAGRLLGGLLYPPDRWRWAFATAAALLGAALAAAWRWLPAEGRGGPQEPAGLRAVLLREDLFRLYCVGGGAFFVFSSLFNFLPFRLHGPPFHWPARAVTLLYLSYLVGVAAAPLAGRLSGRIGSGAAMLLGALVLAGALSLSLAPSGWAMAAALALVCAGFFTIHAAAAGALNHRLQAGRGRANALYVLFYYLGGFAGITASGLAWRRWGWAGVVALAALALLVPFTTGLAELRSGRGQPPGREAP